jgi:hypothetical protein
MMSESFRKDENFENHGGLKRSGELSLVWGKVNQALTCENCDWRFFRINEITISRCPHCYSQKVASLDQEEISHLITDKPERFIPFSTNLDLINRSFQKFIKSIRFAPKDLSIQSLQDRLTAVFFPNWLVDVEVEAIWEAEFGYDYEVVSHRERYDQNFGGWKTQEITETRTRWEKRVGCLNRAYQNLHAPGMEEDVELIRRIGKFDIREGELYEISAIEDSFVSLPSRSTEDAWPAAIPTVQAVASSECLQAASADHIRQFRWNPSYRNHNWSLLLMPMYTTYYLDDDNIPQVVHLNGQTGRLFGARRASMKKARRSSLIIVVIALVIFMMSVVLALGSLVLPPLIIPGGIGIILSILVGIMAVIPVGIVWQFNRSEK